MVVFEEKNFLLIFGKKIFPPGKMSCDVLRRKKRRRKEEGRAEGEREGEFLQEREKEGMVAEKDGERMV